MRILVVFYSLSGVTRTIAERAAKELGADIAEVRTARYAPGFFGFMRAGFDSWRGALPRVEGPSPDRYDFVLALGPVWAGRAATPIRAYLAQNRGRLKRTAFVLTCGGWCPARVFEEMTQDAGVKPAATLTLTEREIKESEGLPAALSSYLSALKLKQAA
jgi:flavodoxin